MNSTKGLQMTENAQLNTVLTKSLSTFFSARTAKSQSEEGENKRKTLGSLQGGLYR